MKILFATCLSLAACASDPAPEAAPEPAIAIVDSLPPPLDGEWIETLRDEAGEPIAMVTLPLGSREPKPLVIAVHGALSRPDWMCGAVRDTLGPDTFVVCPHSAKKLDAVASWGSGPQLHAAVDRALAAALARFGAHVDRSRLVYFGHSQGSMALPAAYAAAPASVPFAGVIFFEGVPKDTSQLARTVNNLAATDVLFVTGQTGWAPKATALTTMLNTKGFHARHAAGTFGHFFGRDAIDLLRRETPALLAPRAAHEYADGDVRQSSLTAVTAGGGDR